MLGSDHIAMKYVIILFTYEEIKTHRGDKTSPYKRRTQVCPALYSTLPCAQYWDVKTLEKSHQLCWGNGLGGYLSGYSLPRGQWHASLIANTPTQLTSLNLSVVPTMQPPLCSNSKSSVHPIWIAQGAFVKFESKNLKLVLKERFLTVPAWGIWTMPAGRTVPWDMRELQSV